MIINVSVVADFLDIAPKIEQEAVPLFSNDANMYIRCAFDDIDCQFYRNCNQDCGEECSFGVRCENKLRLLHRHWLSCEVQETPHTGHGLFWTSYDPWLPQSSSILLYTGEVNMPDFCPVTLCFTQYIKRESRSYKARYRYQKSRNQLCLLNVKNTDWVFVFSV